MYTHPYMISGKKDDFLEVKDVMMVLARGCGEQVEWKERNS